MVPPGMTSEWTGRPKGNSIEMQPGLPPPQSPWGSPEGPSRLPHQAEHQVVLQGIELEGRKVPAVFPLQERVDGVHVGLAKVASDPGNLRGSLVIGAATVQDGRQCAVLHAVSPGAQR